MRALRVLPIALAMAAAAPEALGHGGSYKPPGGSPVGSPGTELEFAL